MQNRLSRPLLMILSALFLMACLALPGETKAHPRTRRRSQVNPSPMPPGGAASRRKMPPNSPA